MRNTDWISLNGDNVNDDSGLLDTFKTHLERLDTPYNILVANHDVCTEDNSKVCLGIVGTTTLLWGLRIYLRE